MTTIPAPGPQKPPARTGKCSLTLSIDGRRYRLRSATPLTRGSRTWRLTVAAGQSRAGLTYSVSTIGRRLDCTCPDSARNFAACKHMQALRALGLVPKSSRPTGELTWELLHPKAPRKQRVAAPIAAPPITAPGPVPLAKARRRHQPTTGEASLAAALLGSSRTEAPSTDTAAASFAAGFRTAVAEHTARLATGGAS
jgi:hypothetical protein